LLDEYQILLDPTLPGYQQAVTEIAAMISIVYKDTEILERFIGTVEQIIRERKTGTYDWRKVNLSKRIIFEALQIYWTTYTLGATFYQCFQNVRDYLGRLLTFDGNPLLPDLIQSVPLHLTSLFSTSDLFNLELIGFDDIFITGVVDQTQIDKILSDAGIIHPADVFLQLDTRLTGKVENIFNQGKTPILIDLEAISSPDLVLTTDRLRIAKENLAFFNDTPEAERMFQEYVKKTLNFIDKERKEFLDLVQYIPLDNTSYKVGTAQKKILEKTLINMPTSIRREFLERKLRDLTGYLNLLRDDKEGSSLLKKFLDLLRYLQIPVTIQTVSVNRLILTQEINFNLVRKSYEAQIKNRATTTSQKILLTIRKKEGYEIQGDFSIFLGKYLADTGTDLTALPHQGSLPDQSFSLLVASVDQDQIALETIVENWKTFDFSNAFRNSAVSKISTKVIDQAISSFTSLLNLPNFLKTQVTNFLTWKVRDEIRGYVEIGHPNIDLDTEFPWLFDRLTELSSKVSFNGKGFWKTLERYLPRSIMVGIIIFISILSHLVILLFILLFILLTGSISIVGLVGVYLIYQLLQLIFKSTSVIKRVGEVILTFPYIFFLYFSFMLMFVIGKVLGYTDDEIVNVFKNLVRNKFPLLNKIYEDRIIGKSFSDIIFKK